MLRTYPPPRPTGLGGGCGDRAPWMGGRLRTGLEAGHTVPAALHEPQGSEGRRGEEQEEGEEEAQRWDGVAGGRVSGLR